MAARWIAVAALGLVAACYAPTLEPACKVTCPSNVAAGDTSSCPGDLACFSGVCKQMDGTCPAEPMPDASPQVDAANCFGQGLVRLCFVAPPNTSVVEPMAISTFDTDTESGCFRATPINDSSHPVCVLYATSISVPNGAIIKARGSIPLVWVVTGQIQIAGHVDLRANAVVGILSAGANASGGDCPDGILPNGGGGGAGGSFFGRGGGGGSSNGQNGGSGGAPTATFTHLRGGCPGRRGGNNNSDAGASGGAFYMIAQSIEVTATGEIDVSGGPGNGGPITGGGGGGGSGGLIGFDASALSISGGARLDGNGGSGGCGGGTAGSGLVGQGGSGSTAPNVAAPGCSIPSINARGGDGSQGASVAGGSGFAGTGDAGGGGGGGASGYIIAYPSTIVPTQTSLVSPPIISPPL